MGSITCDLNDLFEETVEQENKFSGRVFDVFVKTVKCSDGKLAEREVVMHNGGAAILAVDDDLNCHMISQFRSPIEEVILEVPAGKIEKGEDPLACAEREIVEETRWNMRVSRYHLRVTAPRRSIFISPRILRRLKEILMNRNFL